MLDRGVRDLRVGFVRHFHELDKPAHPEVTAAVEDAARVLQAEGAEVRTVTLPSLNEFAAVNRVILCSEAWSIHAPWLRSRPGDYGQLSRQRLMPGAFMNAGDYVGAQRRRLQMIAAVEDAFRDFDVLICASSMDPASRIEDAAETGRTYPRQARTPFNVTGHPALAMMAGLSGNGLPVSVQFVGRYFEDATVLRVAAAYERGTGVARQSGKTPADRGDSSTAAEGLAEDHRCHRPHVAQLLLAAAAAALRRLGQPDAPPLLLVHGGRDHCRNWDWVAAALRDEYHIIAPDLRGHGDSAWSASGHYTMASYIYDLAQLIHQQELAPVAIVAHSLGGNIALALCRHLSRGGARLVVIEGLGPAAAPAWREAAQVDRRTHARRGSTSSASLVGPAAAALRLDRGRAAPHAGGEPASVRRAGAPPDAARREPERGRHL